MKYQRLHDLRVDNDLTQKQVGEYLHCRAEVYRRYEVGIRELPLSYAIKLAKFYGVSLDYLVGLSDIKNEIINTSKTIGIKKRLS